MIDPRRRDLKLIRGVEERQFLDLIAERAAERLAVGKSHARQPGPVDIDAKQRVSALAVEHELHDLDAESDSDLMGDALDLGQDLSLFVFHGPIKKKGGLAPTLFRRNTACILAESAMAPQIAAARGDFNLPVA
jgi:hypothetical protein